LSGGEAQRTSLARAMVLEPEVLLLDEPFSSLDAPTRESLIDDLDAVLTERQVATVFVTHDRSEALRMGDRIAVLIGGRLRQVGSPNEVFSSPLDQEIAAFVGVENIIPGRVHSVADGLGAVEVAAGVIETATELEAGAEVLVCVRPEDVVLSREADAYPSLSARNHMRATVARVRSAGPYVRVEINAGFPLVALVTKQSREDLSLKPGSSVFATFKATAVHLIPHRRG
jgi:tungstate transport system ATP-binding protein